MAEEWRKIDGFPAHSVSNLGRVRRDEVSVKGHRPGIRRPYLNNMGYAAIEMHHGGKRKRFLVSRLVCAAFNGPQPTPLHEVAHNDGDPSNNTASNLRWATRSENMEDARKHGTMAMGRSHGTVTKPGSISRGERHGHAKLTAADIVDIRSAPRAKGSGRLLAHEYGVSPALISLIRSRKIWTHI